MLRSFKIMASLLLLVSCNTTKKTLQNINAFGYTTQKKVVANYGVVVSAHPLASKVGVEILKRGGNAVDAAIATQLALAVVYPNAGNIGGGGFMVAHLSNGENVTLDYRERAPASAHRYMYLDALGNVIPDKSLRSPSSSGVPGTIAGLFESMKYAKLRFTELIQPAIELAEKGFVITEREAASLNNLQADLRKYNTMTSVFQKTIPWITGDTLIQKDLAATLIRIKDGGAAGFYHGETARLIVEEMKRGGGYVNYQDLKDYTAKWRTPHGFTYRGHYVVTMPLPSSGGLLLNQMLKMIEDKPLTTYGYNSARTVQLMTEVERRAYADRAQFMGDADFYKVPVLTLVSQAYLNKRMLDYKEGVAGSSATIKPGDIKKESEETTHLSVIDKFGNAVSVTTTLNDSYGSKTVVGGAGFLLNDEMDDFSVKPGVPNMYGAVGGEANAIAPNKRMLSSMTPTIVLKNGKPFLIVGTPGGTTIPTSVFQTIVNVIDFGLTTDEAVNGPKFHHQWLPDQIEIEKSFPYPVRAALEKMGYKLNVRSTIGRTEVIRIFSNRKKEGVADSRGDDGAEGYLP